MKLVHPVDEALEQFDLIAGEGAEADKKACAMTLLTWMAGREWSDKPQCANTQIASHVIKANDAQKTTKAQRAELVRLGVDGVLDTWWIPREVVAYNIALASKERKGTYTRAKRLLERIAEWKEHKEKPNLQEANLQEANLRGADLQEANLQEANLQGADLQEANLQGADLWGANLQGADLWGVNLQEANLRGADLQEANLRGANLQGADLWGVNLQEANLRGADLQEANLRGADLRGADLWGAKGNEYTRLPDDYEVTETGTIQKRKML